MSNLQVASTRQETVTMTSIELVDFINSLRASTGAPVLTHSDFKKKVKRVLSKDHGNFSDIFLDGYGRPQDMYKFPKREATLMAMSYSHEISAQVYDRMEALERQAASPIQAPQSMVEALRLALDQAEKIEQQQIALAMADRQLTLAAPKVQFHDAFVKQGYNYTATDVAKKLGISATRLNRWLVEQDALFGTRKHFKQWYIDKGFGVEKFYGQSDNGTIYSSIFHTDAGAQWIMSTYNV